MALLNNYPQLLAAVNRWLKTGGSNGDWRADPPLYSGAEGHSRPTGLAIAGIPIVADPAAPRDSWAIIPARLAGPQGAGEDTGLILPDGWADRQLQQLAAQQNAVINNWWTTQYLQPARRFGKSWVTQQWSGYVGSFAVDAAFEPQVKTEDCKSCGAVFVADAQHSCPQPSQRDLDAVTTIQKLTAAGLSSTEIAADMGVVVGWRVWAVGVRGLHGAGAGEGVTWPVDRPLLAVCINSACAKYGSDEHCEPKRPPCRAHAMKTRDSAAEIIDDDERDEYVLGQVAMWGDVVECEDGWIASRAYPLALQSEPWARAYRVARLEPQPVEGTKAL